MVETSSRRRPTHWIQGCHESGEIFEELYTSVIDGDRVARIFLDPEGNFRHIAFADVHVEYAEGIFNDGSVLRDEQMSQDEAQRAIDKLNLMKETT